MTKLATYYVIALGISLVLTPLCRAVAHRLGFVAKPKEDRWHQRPTALFGGVAIAVTTLGLGLTIGPDPRVWQLLACGFVAARKTGWHQRPTALFGGVAIAVTTLGLRLTIGPDPRVWQLLACGLAIAAFGLVDDVMSLKASTKLIRVQIIVASAVVVLRVSAANPGPTG